MIESIVVLVLMVCTPMVGTSPGACLTLYGLCVLHCSAMISCVAVQRGTSAMRVHQIQKGADKLGAVQEFLETCETSAFGFGTGFLMLCAA